MGYVGCLWSLLTPGFYINLFARRLMQYFSFSGLRRGCACNPMQHSPTQCLSSLDSHFLVYSGCKGAGNLSAGPLADPQVSLAPAPCTAQPVLEPTSSLRKGFVISFQCTYCDWEFHWSHAIKLYRELKVIALSTLKQHTWKIIVKYKVMLKYSTKE